MMIAIQARYFLLNLLDDDYAKVTANGQDLAFISEWLDYSFEQLDVMFGGRERLRKLPIPVTIHYAPGILSGGTGDGRLEYSMGDFSEEILRANVIAFGIYPHELVNLWTGETVTACWPYNWWADGKSPFPVVITEEIMRRKGCFEEAERHFEIFKSDRLVVMFNNWLNEFGAQAFKKAFDVMRINRINLCALPSEKARESATAAALSVAITESRLLVDLREVGIVIDEGIYNHFKTRILSTS